VRNFCPRHVQPLLEEALEDSPAVLIQGPRQRGKTTLATNLARALHESGRSVLVVDSDPQGSARDWHAMNEANPLPLVALDRANNLNTVKSVAGAYDRIVIDGAAKLENMLAAAIKVSDLVLIPVQPSPYDVWATGDLVELVQARREVTGGRPVAAFVVTRKIDGTRLGADVRQVLAEYDLPVLAAEIVQRQVYPRTAAAGLTVFDGDDSKARAEIEGLTEEVLAMLERERARG